jgi:hypothetical protein
MRFMLPTVLLLVVLICSAVLLRLVTPAPWPIPTGTLTVKTVQIDGKKFLMIDGESMNYLGQIQSIDVTLDPSKKSFLVSRCIIRKNPFTKIVVNNQWPVFYPIESLPKGKYSIQYKTANGNTSAGTIDVL